MPLPYELQIGLRYTRAGRRSGRRNRFISFISGLSAAGIMLGVAALIIVLSVMNGFQKEVRDRMLSVLSHIELSGAQGPLDDWQALLATAKTNPAVQAGAPFVAGQVMLARDDGLRGALVRGIDPALEPSVAPFAGKLAEGALTDLQPGAFGIVVGRELGRQLGLRLGDRLTLIAPQGTVTPGGIVPRLRSFDVRGFFESGHFEYDSALVLMHAEDAARLFRTGGVTGVRLRIDDMQAAPRVARELERALPASVLVRDWSRENRNWFAAVQVEKRMMTIILALIVAVAAFNLVSMLVMTVTDKQSDIAILRTLGAQPGSIMRIFVVQGALIGWLGTLAGIALGLLVAFNIDALVAGVERLFGFQVLPQGVYFISYLPSDVHLDDVARIGVLAFVLSLAATLYPSWRASRVRPAEALRHE